MFKKTVVSFLIAFSLPTHAREVEVSDIMPDVTRGTAHLAELGPIFMARMQKVLAENCPAPVAALPDSLIAKACSFYEVSKIFSEYDIEWQKFSTIGFDNLNGPITFNPRADEYQWRAGIWNVDMNNPDDVAQKSSEAYLRFLITRHVMRSTVEAAADWVQTIGNGAMGTFGEYYRPLIFAWLSSTSPMERLTNLSDQMKCGPTQIGCEVIRTQFAKTSLEAFGNLTTALGSLDQVNANTHLQDVVTLDILLEGIFQLDNQTLLTWVQSPEVSSPPAEIQAYISQIKPMLIWRKNLMPGEYSMAGQMAALVLLSDLKRYAQRVNAPQAQVAPLEVGLAPSYQARVQNVVDSLVPDLKNYNSWVQSLVQLLSRADVASALP